MITPTLVELKKELHSYRTKMASTWGDYHDNVAKPAADILHRELIRIYSLPIDETAKTELRKNAAKAHRERIDAALERTISSVRRLHGREGATMMKLRIFYNVNV